jgi:hypothetical protein
MAILSSIEYTIPHDKKGIKDLFMSSGQFRVDNECSWAKGQYLQASDRMFIDVHDDSIVLSENGGAGFLAIICTIKIINLSNRKSKLIVGFKTGTLNLDILKYIFFLFVILSISFIVISMPISLLFFFISLFVLLIWISKKSFVKSTIRKIEKILKIERVR